MMYTLRPHQQRAIDNLHNWWQAHPNITDIPLLVQPTGAGKSIIIAELVRLLFDTWPDHHPRTVVIVPSKELAEQNAEKLINIVPQHLSVGYYSASMGRKNPDADIIVATIGSIYKDAGLLGDIKCVVIDEAHLVNPNGKYSGRYRQFLNDLERFCRFRVLGLTATPFRGNGIWLTDGEDPLFTGIADNCSVTELLEYGYLSPLVRPVDAIRTKINTAGISTTNGDYNIKQLSERVEQYINAVVPEIVTLAIDRKKWIAFCPTVENAEHLCDLLNDQGISTAVVCGSTPKREREALIEQFRSGELHCLVTVLALATGFDVPDVDCIIWFRPTISPVLYVQGAGRGLRIADGKSDCLWLDFTDTTERLGPIDKISGRARKPKNNSDAPCIICDNCGARVVPASTVICPECGYQMREPEKPTYTLSNSAVMSSQLKINDYAVTDIRYSRHSKPGKPDSIRVDYYSGIRKVVTEWVCPLHDGFAGSKGINWLRRRIPETEVVIEPMSDVDQWLNQYAELLIKPTAITVNESQKYPQVIKYDFNTTNEK